MEKVGNSRVALIGILVENTGETAQLNEILHEYAPYIIGRMGVPYAKKEVNIISVAVDAPEAKISALSGRLGMLDGVMYADHTLFCDKKQAFPTPQEKIHTV